MHTVELWVLTFHMTAESQDLPGIYSHYTANEARAYLYEIRDTTFIKTESD